MFIVSDSIRSTQSQDGAVVLDIRRGLVYGVNVAGSRILELVEQGCEEQQIAQEISRQFHITLEIAADDVRKFLASLERHRLVVRRSGHVTR